MDNERATELLAAERRRIEASLAGRAPAPADDLSLTDDADQATDTFDAELDESLADELRAELHAVERAEQRLADGTYGLSIESGEPIPDERLEVHPTAELTTEEQARLEGTAPGLTMAAGSTELRAAGAAAPDGTSAWLEPDRREHGFTHWRRLVARAGKRTLEDNMPMIASALAYSTFFAIPSVLLVVVGVFTLLAGPGAIDTVIAHLGRVMPAQATDLVHGSLTRLDQHPSTGIAMTAVGLVLAVWSTSGAMTSYMTGVNLAYGHSDTRKFVRKRLTALVLVGCIGGAFLLVAALLVLGPTIESSLGRKLGLEPALGWIWWTAQWPILVAGLLAAFATLLRFAPDDRSDWRFLTPGSGVAVVIWLLCSGAFAVYTSMFGSYNKTWGSLSAVIVTLTWLWLSALALLFGAELNAEIERSRG